uniref:BCL2/adenovirus E1B 19 kDa protein-interacting protein 2-like n=1 Tax=Epinephelus lanceolatus TaxID=310571 RepID=UPI0014455A8B|nr:BCL2/adenovirus E1B 19 kDa protein-interacting protein 2-like [Epinephelus lanceolatus]
MRTFHGYAMDHGKKAKKKLAAPDISITLDRSEGSLLSDELDESTELDLDDIDTPSDNSNEFEWEDDLPKPKTTELLQKGVESVQEYSAADEREEGRRWRVFRIGDQEHRVDMKAIEPYKRVISHGGQHHATDPLLSPAPGRSLANHSVASASSDQGLTTAQLCSIDSNAIVSDFLHVQVPDQSSGIS